MLVKCINDFEIHSFVKFEKDKEYLFAIINGILTYCIDDKYYEISTSVLKNNFTLVNF